MVISLVSIKTAQDAWIKPKVMAGLSDDVHVIRTIPYTHKYHISAQNAYPDTPLSFVYARLITYHEVVW